jgi:hypothetical protein
VFTANTAGRHDEEVAVARGVPTTERERAHEIRPTRFASRIDRMRPTKSVRRSFKSGKWCRARCTQPARPPRSPTQSGSQIVGWASVRECHQSRWSVRPEQEDR